MSPKASERKVIEAKISSWIRHHTDKKKEFFFSTRALFNGIELDYDDKNDYRMVMDIIHQWRRQAPFFYQVMVQDGELTGKTIYRDFEQFLKDWNATGCYFLWNRNVELKDGTIVYGFHQPINADEKINIDTMRSIRCVKQLKNRFAEMVQMGHEPLSSGYTPELALASIERFESKYLLPEGKSEKNE